MAYSNAPTRLVRGELVDGDVDEGRGCFSAAQLSAVGVDDEISDVLRAIEAPPGLSVRDGRVVDAKASPASRFGCCCCWAH